MVQRSGALAGPDGVPTADVERCRRSHASLLADLEGLSDESARAPSLLPGWSVGHVLTHVARNADSVVRRLEGAARGEMVDQYPGGFRGRAAEIEGGAGRPAAELVEDVRRSAARVERVWDTLPVRAWGRLTRDVNGHELPAATIVFSRWREVEVHHADLGLGYGPHHWPAALIERWLPVELERVGERCDPVVALAWLLGRGPAPRLDPW